jgi:purine nucleosidase
VAGGARPLVVDTDIGTNVDDLLALLLVLGSPELDPVGVVTVSGDTAVRAALARRVLDAAGRPDVPVLAGRGTALSGRAPRWAGHEADVAAALAGEATDRLPDGGPGDATDWLRDAARRHAGRLEVAALGPLTDLAVVGRFGSGWADAVHRVWAMAGPGPDGSPDHNLAADAVAAAEVFAAGGPLVRCGLDATAPFVLDGDRLRATLGPAARSPLGALVLDHAARTWAARGVTGAPPHDALALLPAVRPDLVTTTAETVAVRVGGADEGRLVPGPGRPVRRVVAFAAPALDEVLRRVAAAVTAAI